MVLFGCGTLGIVRFPPRARCCPPSGARRVFRLQIENARGRYEATKNRFLRLGGLISVLTRRYNGQESAAISQVGNRTGLSREQLAYALTLWTKEKQRRARLKRDLVIYSEDLRGDRQKDIAARHQMTARRVREIVAEVKARIHRAR